MDLGLNIQKARKRKDISQEEMANKLGVSRQAVSLWETNQTVPSVDNLVAISELVGLSISVLMGQIPFPDEARELQEREKAERLLKQKQEQIEKKENIGAMLSKFSLVIGVILALGLFLVVEISFLICLGGIVLGIFGIIYKKGNKVAVWGLAFNVVYFIASILVVSNVSFYQIL